MKKISQVLIDSQKTRKQIVGKYFGQTFDDKSERYEEIDSYCAMGALYCEADYVEVSESNGNAYTKGDLAEAYGLKSFMMEETLDCPHCSQSHPVKWITDYIVHLNDFHKKTFEEIGNIVKDLGY